MRQGYARDAVLEAANDRFVANDITLEEFGEEMLQSARQFAPLKKWNGPRSMTHWIGDRACGTILGFAAQIDQPFESGWRLRLSA
jgi:hypothetical protein